jgi:hypothetical protein
MMTNGTNRIAELLSAPMEAVVVALGVGVARAQRELDRFSIETQREINEDPMLSELGLQASWYQMPRAEFELTTAIALDEQEPAERTPAGPATPRARVLERYRLKQLHLQPINAVYANQFAYDVQASSKLKLIFVPVPPPAAETAVAPRLTREQVIALAQPNLVNEADGSLQKGTRLAVNFNGQGRIWFILQYKLQDDETVRVALVVVDDDTGQVVKHTQGR